MKRLTAPWTTALATAALFALPIAGGAQTPQTPPEPQPEQSTTLSTPTADPTQNESPAHHLRQAKDALASIDENTIPARAKSQLAALRRHINALERSVAANDNASATGTAKRSAKATRDARGNVNWANDVAAIDRIITQLAGNASTSMTGTGNPGTAGTSGTEPRSTARSKSSDAVALDDSTRNQLMEVRTHITAFAAAMSGTGSASSPTAASSQQPSAASTSPMAGSTSTSGQSGSSAAGHSGGVPQSGSVTTGQTASQTESTSATSGQAASSTSGQAGSPADETATMTQTQDKVDSEAAKNHLTAARDALTQLTQLPAAAQLQGEARTQVSQLIQNFNDLITTQSDWRATYAKLEANLNALIGPAPNAASAPPPTETPESTPEATAATPPATPTDPPAATSTQGTQEPGAVGTSGTAAPALDPAIRQKLVEFRQHLLAFHSAAGGDAK